MQGYFVDIFSPLAVCFDLSRRLTATDGAALRQPHRNFIMFADRMYFGVCVAVDFVQILHPPQLRVGSQCHLQKEQSGSCHAICMISWFAEQVRAPGPGITLRSEVVSILAKRYKFYLSIYLFIYLYIFVCVCMCVLINMDCQEIWHDYEQHYWISIAEMEQGISDGDTQRLTGGSCCNGWWGCEGKVKVTEGKRACISFVQNV